MLESGSSKCLKGVKRITNAAYIPPTFLAPSISGQIRIRSFSASPARNSHIGSSPITLPPEVSFKIQEATSARDWTGSLSSERRAEIKGPLGILNLTIPPFMEVDHNESKRQLKVNVQNWKERRQREMWGTTRAYLSNYVLGVSEGHSAILRLVGVGYRASLEKTPTKAKPLYPGQEFISLKVGFTHPIELGVPRGVKASVPQPTRILLEGVDKEVINQFAAEIRWWRKPEPYKGKGIFVNGETIKLKNKKIK